MNLLFFISVTVSLAAIYAQDPTASKERGKKLNSGHELILESKCRRNERLNHCGARCDTTCLEVISKKPFLCPAICDPPACVCVKGYARDKNKRCILDSQCTDENTCPAHEEVNRCGAYCELKCTDVITGKPPRCPKICGPPACVCKKGFARANKQCIPENQCREEPR